MQKPPLKKKLVRRKKKVVGKPGAKAPGMLQHVLAPPPKPKPVMDFTDKDPWGYRFATPMWKLDAATETMKRDPKDGERERILAVLQDIWALDPKRVNEGFDSEVIPWGLFREETKLGKRRLFAEAIRKECLESRTGLLGIAQVHYLASKHGFLTTLRAKADRAAFPLMLEIEETTVKDKYRAQYVLQIDRVFYPVTKLPQLNRFALPDLVVDGFRVLDQGGETLVRSGDKKVVSTITTASKPESDKPFHWLASRAKLPAIELKEMALFVDDKPAGSIVSNVPKDSHAVDYTLRFNQESERGPLLGLLIAFIDAFLQRKLGVLERARKSNQPGETTDAPA